MNTSRLDALKASLAPTRAPLLAHSVHRRIVGVESLRCFMESHVFAVWDFMSLLKALQRALTCVDLPWTPSRDPEACRLINEIVLAEESDDNGNGGHPSHFELYRDAMLHCGANTEPIDRFLRSLQGGMKLDQALESAPISHPTRQFVRTTFDIIAGGNVCAIAASFAFGREELLPDLFRRIVDGLQEHPQTEWNAFRYYLDRHIDLDSGEHGPNAEILVQKLCGENPAYWQAAGQAAVRSLEARLALWDGMVQALGES